MGKQITVVIPTYNRVEQLSRVIDHLLASDVEGFSLVEIIVVDDGSAVSPESMIASKSVAAPFTLRCERQENAGPAKARNNGYRRASADTVLFIDDDILVSPGLLTQHVEAHDQYPGSVIIGPCPCVQPDVPIPSSRYIRSLEHAALADIPAKGFAEVNTVVSGNLSIERRMFFDDNGMYDDNLNSPTAEEFDVIAKLRRRRIPVYLGKELVADHLQPTGIEATCLREYKHAVGIGELAVKAPHLADELDEIKNFLAVNGEGSSGDPAALRAKKAVKRVLSGSGSRHFGLGIVKGIERILPLDALMFPLFRTIIGLNIFAGVRDGIKKFGSQDL